MAKDYKEQLREWLEELDKWGRGDKVLWEYGEDFARAKIYTDGNEYNIRAHADYLGCIVNSRKPRPGEDWHRGNDLADGKLNYETWNRILRDIIAYELKSISDYILNPPADDVKVDSADKVV